MRNLLTMLVISLAMVIGGGGLGDGPRAAGEQEREWPERLPRAESSADDAAPLLPAALPGGEADRADAGEGRFEASPENRTGARQSARARQPGEVPPPELGFGSASGQAGEAVLPRYQTPPVAVDLERFGAGFFRRSEEPAAAAPLPVDPDYVLAPGDQLQIDLWGKIEGNYEPTIDRNGDIFLPRVGVIHLWGRTLEAARHRIREEVAQYFSGFELNVSLGALRSMDVYLVGEVPVPGTYKVGSLATVLTLLNRAGGVADNGSMRRIQVLRGGKVARDVDLYDFLLRGDKSSDIRLAPGDTVFVPVVGPLVGVAGNVHRPAVYELAGGTTLEELLAMAGGLIPTAYLNRIQIERVAPHQATTVLDIDYTKTFRDSPAAKFALQDRDLVKVEPIAERAGFVELLGHVTRPGRYQFVPGMRIADLFRDKDNLLPGYYPERAQLIRMRPPEFRQELLTFDLGAALAGEAGENLRLEEFDQVQVYSREDMEETLHVFAYGAVLKPGKYRLYEGMRIRDLVIRAGNLRRNAYLESAEVTRSYLEGEALRTERLTVDLQRALAGEPEHNLALQADDHLVVRGIAEFEERNTVEIRGEVAFPGTYALQKGERLSSLLRRAGGFTGDAYLRGAVFTRDALKDLQQERLDQLILEQEQALLAAASELSQTALGETEVEAARQLMEGRKALLERLRQAAVTGRMVVRLQPLENFAGTPADIELKPGDSLLVPANPDSVTVLGEVYNPVAITHVPGRTVQHYLDQVGGPKESAETDEIFVVRADGTVLSRQQGGMGIKWDPGAFRWVAGFGATEVYPGDTILVPQKVVRTAWLREFKDISTIIYQMALGAAAVASF